MDRLLDKARSGGAFYLRQPAVADMIVEAILYDANILGHYRLRAFVVMPNHVHLLATPAVVLPKLTKSLKGITAKRANAMLASTRSPFWQTLGAGMSGNSRGSGTTLRAILYAQGKRYA